MIFNLCRRGRVRALQAGAATLSFAPTVGNKYERCQLARRLAISSSTALLNVPARSCEQA